ncbi:hypothetical protein F5B19DRAFT_435505 [Rostrohypoxylon terebratum]|nr:hypothetical protein F5B19DRAFT_435505 [Rostrohypoxylon terebratum]
MAHPRCLAHPSLARALHRVFVSGLSATTPSLRRQTASYLLPPWLFSTYSHHVIPKRQPLRLTTSPSAPQTRPLSTTPALQRIVNIKKRPLNDQIPHDWVRLVQEDGGLTEPEPLTKVLNSINTRTHTLVMVAPPRDPIPERVTPPIYPHFLEPGSLETLEPGSPETLEPGSLEHLEPESPETLEPGSLESLEPGSPEHLEMEAMAAPPPPPAAICRIIDNASLEAAQAELEAAQAAMEATLRRRALDVKEIEMSWSITPHDLSHKLKRIQTFLNKGLKVEISLARKRRGRDATRDEAHRVILAIREAVSQVEGVQETRKVEGTTGGFMKMFFAGPEGKRKKKRKQLEEEGAAAAEAGER